MSAALTVIDGDRDDATRACASCHGPCCYEHLVPISGFDLVRITLALQIPWDAVASIELHRLPLFQGFRLDRGPVHHVLTLKRNAFGACRFLIDLDGKYRRCGIHALRPGACRVYPLVPALYESQGAEFGNHAICPEGPAAIYRGAVASFRPHLEDDAGERALYARALERWDLLARHVPVERPLSIDQFVAWAASLYLAIAPLRTGERGEWQLEAYRLIEQFPLPA